MIKKYETSICSNQDGLELVTENDEQEHKHVEDDCKRADIKTLHVLTSNRMNFVKNICKVLRMF